MTVISAVTTEEVGVVGANRVSGGVVAGALIVVILALVLIVIVVLVVVWLVRKRYKEPRSYDMFT